MFWDLTILIRQTVVIFYLTILVIFVLQRNLPKFYQKKHWIIPVRRNWRRRKKKCCEWDEKRRVKMWEQETAVQGLEGMASSCILVCTAWRGCYASVFIVPPCDLSLSHTYISSLVALQILTLRVAGCCSDGIVPIVGV